MQTPVPECNESDEKWSENRERENLARQWAAGDGEAGLLERNRRLSESLRSLCATLGAAGSATRKTSFAQ